MADTTLLINAMLIDGNGGAPQANRAVLVNRERKAGVMFAQVTDTIAIPNSPSPTP